MVWRRLPSFLPNLRLVLLPFTEAQQATYEKTGFVRELAFRTAPNVNKVSCQCQCSRSTASAQGAKRPQLVATPATAAAAILAPAVLPSCAVSADVSQASGSWQHQGAGGEPGVAVAQTLPHPSPPPPQAEIKAFLESVYGLRVANVNTLNYEGKKKRSKHGYHRCGRGLGGRAGGRAGPDRRRRRRTRTRRRRTRCPKDQLRPLAPALLPGATVSLLPAACPSLQQA